MNRIKPSQLKWWHKYWNLSANDSKNFILAMLSSFVFMVLLATSGILLDPKPGDFKTMLAWQWILALAPMIPGVGAVYLWVRFLRQVEELYRKVITTAAATSFSIAFVLHLIIHMLGNNIIGEESIDISALDMSGLTWTVMLFSFVISWRLYLRHYE